jgi:predicted dithiol-disulfide oxidoreductase (DUF899 family)
MKESNIFNYDYCVIIGENNISKIKYYFNTDGNISLNQKNIEKFKKSKDANEELKKLSDYREDIDFNIEFYLK